MLKDPIRFLFVCLGFSTALGCGVKGPPTPAYSTKPEFDVASLPFVSDEDSGSANSKTEEKKQ